MFDTTTGEIVDALSPAVEWQFGWSDDQTLHAVVPDDSQRAWQVVERSVVRRQTVAIASMDGPIAWFAARSS